MSDNTLTPLPLVLGGGTWGQNLYQSDSQLEVEKAQQVIEAAFNAGVRALDTSPWYHPSEYILGQALANLRESFPRDSYKISTKCGRYRPVDGGMFQYEPETIKWSVERSLQLLQTSYIDILLLHDVEFVADPVGKSNEEGFPGEALLEENAQEYGLDADQAGKVTGDGDQKVLEAVRTMLALKKSGSVRQIGISGYPLPTLLRLSIMIRQQLGVSLDVILSYAQHSLRTIEKGHSESNFERFAPLLAERGGISTLICASPLEMGLLATPPIWHPAPQSMQEKITSLSSSVDLTSLALRYGMRPISLKNHESISIQFAVGWSSLEEVATSLEAYKRSVIARPEDVEEERAVVQCIQELGLGGWCWRSGRLASEEALRE